MIYYVTAEECEDESDCNGQGSCIDIQSTDYTGSKQCFCSSGWFGANCELCKLNHGSITPLIVLFSHFIILFCIICEGKYKGKAFLVCPSIRRCSLASLVPMQAGQYQNNQNGWEQCYCDLHIKFSFFGCACDSCL